MVGITYDIQETVDDMFLDPGAGGGSLFGALAHGSHDAVDDCAIKPVERISEAFGWLDKHGIVEFIDVILVQQRGVDRGEPAGEFRRRLSAHGIQIMRQAPP